jgi:uncharacterized protein YwqG
MKRLFYDNTDKSCTIVIEGKILTVSIGKIGGEKKIQSTKYKSEDECKIEAEKFVKEILKKKFIERIIKSVENTNTNIKQKTEKKLTPAFKAALEKIRSAKIPPLKSEEAIYYYDVSERRSLYAEKPDSSIFEKCFDYFIKVSFAKGTQNLGASKLGGYPHLPESWKLPKDNKWKGLQFYAQLNISDFNKYDIGDVFPTQGIFYLFTHPEESRIQVHYDPKPKIGLVVRQDLPAFTKKEQYFTFTPHFIFHAVDVADDDETAAKHIPKKLKDDLEKLLKANMTDTNPTFHIFGRPQFWQGEDEGKRGPSPDEVLLFQGEIEDITIHVWLDRDALKTGDVSNAKLTFSGS